MNKKVFFIYLTVILMVVTSIATPEIVNWIVAKVGDYSITEYDIDKMLEFEMMTGNYEATQESVLEDLLVDYALLTMAEDNELYSISDDDIDLFLQSITNMTNTNDYTAQYRLSLFQTYPEEYRLQIEVEQIMSALLFYEDDLKEKASEEIPEEDIEVFFEENEDLFAEAPSLDIIVFAAEQPDYDTLSALEAFETAWQNIADKLEYSDDAEALIDKYNWIDFLDYTGRTEERFAYELLEEGYPEEILNIPFMDEIPMPTGDNIEVNVGDVISFPQPVPLTESGEMTYLIIKVIDRELNGVMDYEEAKPYIEAKLEQEQIDEVIANYVVDLIEEDEIVIEIIDEDRLGVYDELVRR